MASTNTRVPYTFAEDVVSYHYDRDRPVLRSVLYTAGALGWFFILRGATRRVFSRS